MILAEGDKAPEFRIPATGGHLISLDSYKGKRFILYFYPKADTSGCTKEACAFQDAIPDLEVIGLSVLGVSPDKIHVIEKFSQKYSLTFPLASDENHVVAQRYETWTEKSMYGRKYMGIERSTFLIGADGILEKIWRKINVTGHLDAVMMAARTTKLAG